MNDGLKLRGDVLIERRTKDGKVIEREEIKNLILNIGKERVAKLLNGVETTPFKYIAIGEGTTAPVIGNTGLENESDRSIADDSGGSYEASYKAIWEKTFTFGSGISYSITEACVSDSASASGETLLDRFTFSAKAVDADTDLYVKITVTVS